MNRKHFVVVFVVALALLLNSSGAIAQEQGPQSPQGAIGTAFTYQGQLKNASGPVNDNCDFQFSLWDSADNSTGQIDATQAVDNVAVSSGLFTVQLDFGASAFMGDGRWLEIAVRCPAGGGGYTTLSSRQEMTAVPYAIGLKPGATVQQFNASVTLAKVTCSLHGCTTTGIDAVGGTMAIKGTSTITNGYGLYAEATGANSSGVYGIGTAFGLWGTSTTTGTVGIATGTSGTTYGVYGQATDGSSGYGLFGLGRTAGVYGQSYTGRGVYGNSSNVAGVYGSSPTTGTVGVATAANGQTYGVYGQANSAAGSGVYGYNPIGRGVYGGSINGYGVNGHSDSGRGVWGTSTTGAGVYGDATSGYGVYGHSGTTYGVYGNSPSGRAVGGDSVSGYGVYGDSISGYGVTGHSSSGTGVYGTAPMTGVIGIATAPGQFDGEYIRPGGIGVYGENNSLYGVGVSGQAHDYGYGVDGWSVNGYGIRGHTSSGIGVYGSSSSGYGIYGSSSTNYAGYFSGNVYVNGNLSASGTKSFKIDNPLDPAKQYLYHYAVESPQVQNMYNGTIILDTKGEAVVTLPDYFSAVNRDEFQYQLTAIGAPMPNLYVAEEITGNHFKIAGGVAGKKVSWMIFGQRNDPWVRDHPQADVVDKPANETGTYLYPQGYGQPEALSADYAFNQPMTPTLPITSTLPITASYPLP